MKCIYCNSIENPTKDHIPPKSFFPNPKPSNLITVDSCLNCNKSFEKDDEYFKTILFMRHDVAEHKSGSKQLPILHKMFKRKKSYPFMKSIADNAELKNVVTPAGLFIEQAMQYQPDADRILRFMERLTKGIYFHEMKKQLPKSNSFRLLDKGTLEAQSNEFKIVFTPIFKQLIFNQERKTIGDNVFSYSYLFLHDTENSFIAYFSFFDYVQYIAMSIPLLIENKNV